MALNWVQTIPSRVGNVLEPLLLPGETALREISSVDTELIVPATIEGPKRKDKVWGKVFVTDKRVIFLAYTAKNAPITQLENQIGFDHHAPRLPPEFTESSISSYGHDKIPPFTSLSLPYASITTSKFLQPLFSATSIRLSIRPVSGGGFPELGRGGEVTVTMSFREGKVHEIWKEVEGARERDRVGRVEEETLPRYEPAA